MAPSAALMTDPAVTQAALDGYRTMLRMAVPAAEGGPSDGERVAVRTRLRAAQHPTASVTEKAFLAAFLEVNALVQERTTLRQRLAQRATEHQAAQHAATALQTLRTTVGSFVDAVQPQLPAPASQAEQAAEKGPSAALARSRGAATYA